MKLTVPCVDSDEMEIDPNTLISFPNGLPGLEDCKRFKLFHSGDDPIVFWLHSVDDPDVVLSLTDPDFLHFFYEMTLSDEEVSVLQAEANDELQIAVVLSRQEINSMDAPSAIQANIKSPIVINVSKRIALQKSLTNQEFSIRTYQQLAEAEQDSMQSLAGFHDASRTASHAHESECSYA